MPAVSTALHALHENATHPWTLRELAHLAGVSRSSLAAQIFRIGSSHWLATLCKNQKRLSLKSPSLWGSIGRAFSTAFKTTEGKSPQAFMA